MRASCAAHLTTSRRKDCHDFNGVTHSLIKILTQLQPGRVARLRKPVLEAMVISALVVSYTRQTHQQVECVLALRAFVPRLCLPVCFHNPLYTPIRE
jgi:hypothetical protein